MRGIPFSVRGRLAIAVLGALLAGVCALQGARPAVGLLGLPLSFEENRGQYPTDVLSGAHASGYHLLVRRDRIELATAGGERAVLVLEGAAKAPEVRLEDPQPGVVSYFIGNDPKKWRTGLKTYKKVRYREVYRGIDLVLYGNPSQLEFDFEVAPGADASIIAYRIEGLGETTLESDGRTALRVGNAMVRQEAPVSYQTVAGERRAVASAFRVEEGGTVRFELGDYDRSQPLVIDPVLKVFSTYFGGTSFLQADLTRRGGQDSAYDIATDSNGNAYIAGETNSVAGLAIVGAYDAECGTAPDCNSFGGLGAGGAMRDAFVAKISADGKTLLYATYLGGDGTNGEEAYGIAVDAAGSAVVVGQTDSPAYPTTAGAFDPTCIRNSAYVTKLNPTGTGLIFSGCLSAPQSSVNGPFGTEEARDVALDASGNIYVVGETESGRTAPGNFPTTAGAYMEACAGLPGFCGVDVFVVKIDPSGASLLYSTLLGGGENESAEGIAVDSSGAVYVTGTTPVNLRPGAGPFLTTVGAFQTAPAQTGTSGFVSKISTDGSALVYSTYFTGAAGDQPRAIAVNGNGEAAIVSQSKGIDFPTTSGAYLGSPTEANIALIGLLNAAGSGLVYSTFYGKDLTVPEGVAFGPDGHVWVGGRWGGGFSPGPGQSCADSGFPTTPDAFPAGGLPVPSFGQCAAKAFIAELAPEKEGIAQLEFSTLHGPDSAFPVGGSPVAYVRGEGLATGCDASVYVTGWTTSDAMPVSPGALQSSIAESSNLSRMDAFALRVKDGPQVTIASNLNNIQFTVANVKPGCNTGCEAGTYTAPKTLHWSSGAQCEISFAETQNVSANSRDVFVDWADGGMVNPRTFTPPATNMTYTLNLVRQHRLTTNVAPPPGGSVAAHPVSGDGFYDQGTVVQLTSTASTGYLFTNWSGAVSGSAIPRNVTMGAPRSVTGNFQCVYTLTGPAGAPLPSALPIDGGTFGLEVKTGVNCAWSGLEDRSWLTLSGGPSGNGNGSFQYTAAPNSGPPRSGSITVGDVEYAFIQAGAGTAGAHLGAFTNGAWFVDRNGDSAFDPATEISGWGSPGDTPVEGDWNGDGIRDLGVFSGGIWFLDRNGDANFNPATEILGWGIGGWLPVTGDWNGDGKTDIGAIDPATSTWFIDLNGDQAFNPATEIRGWGSPGDTPVVGDWNGDGADEIGVFSGGTWFIDFNGDGVFDPATDQKGWGVAGWTPVVGDWDGDGADEISAVSPDSAWFRDLNGDFVFDPATEILGWGSPGDKPVVADWNGDGVDDVGVFSGGIWFIDAAGDGAFDPITDIRGWGVAGWTPVPGRW